MNRRALREQVAIWGGRSNVKEGRNVVFSQNGVRNRKTDGRLYVVSLDARRSKDKRKNNTGSEAINDDNRKESKEIECLFSFERSFQIRELPSH